MGYRIENDSMGQVAVPQEALWGSCTQRAVLNFPISGQRLPRRFISALGLIKSAAAYTNGRLGLLDAERVQAIERAADGVMSGVLYESFVVDVFQTGSGTSTNMNANEVIAARASEIMGKHRTFVHALDHVNMSQSSNDVFPTALSISLHQAIKHKLMPALADLRDQLEMKSSQFRSVIKAARTHLQDAIPITLGQEFGGYASQIEHALERLSVSVAELCSLALGGTAVGTGLNAPPQFARLTIARISELSGENFVEARNHFEAQSCLDGAVRVSGDVRSVAVALMKIANDIRWLASGPRCGLGEISLPEVQPGSSIMPAKINPVICESVMMVCAQVVGNDATVQVCAQHGNFELNTMMPVLAFNLLQAVEILAAAALNFSSRCISGITANVDRCRELAERSLAVVTALVPLLGYDRAADLAQQALREDRSLKDVVGDESALSLPEIQRVLDLTAMTTGGVSTSPG